MRKKLLLFKVDFEKAYNFVNWEYLDNVMGRMSFPTLWRKWMKECVCTATASILVNGCPTDEFALKRGLRQGDPISLFLFLIAVEGLNVMMSEAASQNLFIGYSVGRNMLLCFLTYNSWMILYCWVLRVGRMCKPCGRF